MVRYPILEISIQNESQSWLHCNYGHRHGHCHEIRFTSNRNFDERTRDKALGLLKHDLIEEKGYKQSQVNIVWEEGRIEVKKREVASVSDDAAIQAQEGCAQSPVHRALCTEPCAQSPVCKRDHVELISYKINYTRK